MIYTVTFNPAIDYVVRLDRELQVGDVNRARGEDCVLGGKGINVSGVLAQLGCESVALGFVAGETGAWLERGLAAQGLKTDFVHLDHGMTRINVKIKAGQETELNGAGPDIPEAAMQALEQKLDALQKDDILVLAGSIPASLAQTTYERLLARLEGRGIRAVVDATRDLLVNVLPYKPFLIKPNNHELSEITGVRLTNDKEIAAAAHMMCWSAWRATVRCCWMSTARSTASAAPGARSSTVSARATAWWRVLWPVTSRAAAIMRPPSAWAPPAAAPPRSAWVWRRRRILMHCWQRCDAAL